MNELWVARDLDRSLWVYDMKPDWIPHEGVWVCNEDMSLTEKLNPALFPDLLPGQCRRLVMESEVSE